MQSVHCGGHNQFKYMQLSSSNNKQRNRLNNNRVYTLQGYGVRGQEKGNRQEQIYKEIWTRSRRQK